ncbi:MAG: BrnA antitoxin family protein [bacterium]
MAKTPISIRLETDLLDWFKQVAPEGYQVMIQDVLRDYRRAREQRAQNILGRAQQIFTQYHAKCFWHLRKDLKVTWGNLSIIQNGLRKYGGLEGLRLADELDLK